MIRSILLVFLSLFMASCGGGGGGEAVSIPNRAPTITDPGTLSILEGASGIVSLGAEDADGDLLSFSIISGDDQSLFSITSAGILSFVVAPDYEVPTDANTDNVYLLSVQVTDGTLTDNQALSIIITDAFEGRVVDAPISGASVFVDLNGNNTQDAGEPHGTTDENGYFNVESFTLLTDGQAKVVSKGGMDIMTGKALPSLALVSDLPSDLTKPAIVTPLTTVVSVATTPEAKAQVLAALGISGSFEELLTSDGWAEAEVGDENAKANQRVNQQIGMLLQTATTLTDDGDESNDLSIALAESVASQISTTALAQGNIDLTDSATIQSVLTDAAQDVTPTLIIETAVFSAVAKAIAMVNTVVADVTLDPLSDTAKGVVESGQNALQASIVDVVSGDVSVASFAETNDASKLFSNVTFAADAPDNNSDGISDVLDPDDDNDEIRDSVDAFPLDFTETIDTDSDGTGNNANSDDDGDGTVLELDENQAPVISSSSGFSINENQTSIGTIDADDADGDTLTYTISGSEILITSAGALTFASAPDYEAKSSYSATVTVSDATTSVSQDIIVTIRDIPEPVTGLTSSCETFVDDALSNEFRYCWEESQSTSGTEYSANIVQPLTVTFSDNPIEIPNISYAELLYSEYGIILTSETSSDLTWTNDQAYAIHQMMQKIPQQVRNEANDNRRFSKWTLTSSELTDDIVITDNGDDTKSVNVSHSAFSNANPRIASIEGKKGIYFSNRLHIAMVRYVTDNGTNQSKVNKILKERYGVSVDVPDYQVLTSEPASRFQAFQASELIAIINMFEEMPSGFHKIDGLDYLVRRLNGAENPFQPDAPAIAWDTLGYIEFMEKGFKQFSIDYIHRLILHEKAHFLWAKVFDATLKADWVTLGGWYECSENPEGWCTTKQTEFVSAYAHLKNPNEDMAESIASFTVNPDALRSRALAKYEFIRDRIMQGNIYISTIQENLTFEVYNLYPDYVFPGKIKKLQVSVLGDLNEDKTVTVEIELHALNSVLEGASEAFTRIASTADTYVDLYLYPLEGRGAVGTQLKGSFTLTKRAKSGYWKPTQLVLSDEVGNLRMAGVNDFGWRMYVNNLMEDTSLPLYVPNSMQLSLSSEVIESQDVQTIAARWSIDEEYPRENQGCYAALNDENPSTYSLEQYSPQNYGEDYQAGTCYVKWLMPNYMKSGTWRANYIRQIDEAGNETRNYFVTPAGVDTGTNFGGTQLDELAPEVTLTTTNPDTTPPELDLNDIGITATPTNPDNPNGETKVEFRFRVKDDISGYQIGYYTLRDPQGLTTGFYHYPARRSQLFPTSEDLDWFEYTDTVTLPAGSAPGTWGVVELTLRDRAQNFKTYNFTEIISFELSE